MGVLRSGLSIEAHLEPYLCDDLERTQVDFKLSLVDQCSKNLEAGTQLLHPFLHLGLPLNVHAGRTGGYLGI